jgi:ABC-type uncharacterized transport system permease subunit
MTAPASPPAPHPAPRPAPIFAALTGLTSLAILVQAFIAGEFIEHGAHGSWLNAHAVVADVVVAFAIVTAIYAYLKLRTQARPLVIGSITLAVLAAVQTAIGHAITDSNDNWLIPIHVPLALLIFGLTIWLSISARTFRRGA